jgi:predicted nucleic acid-binding protein
MLCDTNILIYAADPADTCCASFVEREDAAIASVSHIEVLGFPGWIKLSQDRQARLQEIVSSMVELGLDERVIRGAVTLRQQKEMSLGDAISAATAIAYDLPLVRRNVEDFKQIEGLTLINPFDPT